MTEVDKRQELSLREVELIRELAQIRKEKSEEGQNQYLYEKRGATT